MSEANDLLARLNGNSILQANALQAFRSNPANFAAVRDMFFDAAGIADQSTRDNAEMQSAVLTAVKVWIGRNQAAIVQLNPALAGPRFSKPETATVEPVPEGPGLFDLVPTAGDISEGFSNALGDIRKTVIWVAVILGVILILPRFLSRPSKPGKSA